VARAYTEDSEWRNRTEFFKGREAIKAFLKRKWEKELDYRLMKELWCFTGNRISVRFEYEWHDAQGQWYRTHGNEHWEFDDDGLMRRRDMSGNDYRIEEFLAPLSSSLSFEIHIRDFDARRADAFAPNRQGGLNSCHPFRR
jgi:uncharacterized protein